ncbi:MAG: high-potential iron-sulfur protein [Pseudomonadota bacterium]|nr:high-potential iron-sulfur protein [Pseudomonadota bacterium]
MNDNANLNRRSLLKRAALLLGAAAIPVGKHAVAAGKAPQAAVKYQDKPQGDQQCDNCIHFEAPSGCKIVEGTVSPKGWCAVWAKKG